MGKKRIVKKGSSDSSVKSGAGKKLPRKKLDSGILYVQSTFNNTKLLLTDLKGNAICAASSGESEPGWLESTTPASVYQYRVVFSMVVE